MVIAAELAEGGLVLDSGWTPDRLHRLLELWDRWHLNDLRAECEHQRARGETWNSHPSAVCADCGYRLGSAWNFEPVAADVLRRILEPRAHEQPCSTGLKRRKQQAEVEALSPELEAAA